jgi:hypothetical protein
MTIRNEHAIGCTKGIEKLKPYERSTAMNEMNQRDVQQHVVILGWLYLVGHAIFLAIGVFVFVLLTGVGVATREPEARTVLGIVGISVGMLLSTLAVPGLLAGYGLLKRRTWARPLAIVVGILNLVNFPIGTMIGIYTFWVLAQSAATDYFTAPAPA